MTKRRSHGEGTITQRGENSFRLRYRIGRQRFSVTFRGTRQEARAKLRDLLKSGDDNSHVEPTRMTLGAWIEHWLSIGAPGRRKRHVGRRSLERYKQLLRTHVIAVLGERRLQQLHATEIDLPIEQTLGPNLGPVHFCSLPRCR